VPLNTGPLAQEQAVEHPGLDPESHVRTVEVVSGDELHSLKLQGHGIAVELRGEILHLPDRLALASP